MARAGKPEGDNRPGVGLSQDETAIDELRHLFQQGGYVRVANLQRRELLGPKYHKGYEVRLVFRTEAEVEGVRQLLKQVGLKAGKPFAKHRRIVQPVYGKSAVKWFLPEALEEGERPRRRRRKRPPGDK